MFALGCASPGANAQQPITTPSPMPVASPTSPSGETRIDTALYRPQSATAELIPSGGITAGASNRAGSSIHAAAAAKSKSDKRRANDVGGLAAQVLQFNSTDLSTPVSLTSPQQSAVVTLTYATVWAGVSVKLFCLDGGTINNATGVQSVAVGVDGTVAFTYQPPAAPGRYQVVAKLGKTEMGIPFDVPSSAAAATAPAAN